MRPGEPWSPGGVGCPLDTPPRQGFGSRPETPPSGGAPALLSLHPSLKSVKNIPLTTVKKEVAEYRKKKKEGDTPPAGGPAAAPVTQSSSGGAAANKQEGGQSSQSKGQPPSFSHEMPPQDLTG